MFVDFYLGQKSSLFSIMKNQSLSSFRLYCYLEHSSIELWHIVTSSARCNGFSIVHTFKITSHLNRPVGWWWIGPANLLLDCGVKYAASGGNALFKLLLGLFANLTVIGSVAPFGVVPFSDWIARSASARWSNRMKPTPLDSPKQGNCQTVP